MAGEKAMKVGLPEEIIVDILFQLPARSIGQFRCVSKKWCTLLSDSKFLKAHHNLHAHKGETKLIFISASYSLHTITFNSQNHRRATELISLQQLLSDCKGLGIGDSLTERFHSEKWHTITGSGISRKLAFQQLPDKWNRIVGSCNGLVLVVDKKDIKFLINPTTLKYHKVPNFELSPPVPGCYGMYGLGYDSVTDDYKVVTLSYPNRLGDENTSVDVYSVKKGLWRRIESSSFDETRPIGASGLFINGALHWYASKTNISQSVIVAFDLSSETFLELEMPECAAFKKVQFSQYLHDLVALRGCLCKVTYSEANKLDVWMMKDYGVVDSWTKFSFTIPSSLPTLPLPICLTSDDDVALDLVREEKLIVYNMREDKWWDLMVDRIYPRYKSTGIFKESLVSPAFDEGSEGYFIA